MTTYQKIKQTYAFTSKAMAYVAYKADPERRTDIEVSFEKFCEVMDKNLRDNPITKK